MVVCVQMALEASISEGLLAQSALLHLLGSRAALETSKFVEALRLQGCVKAPCLQLDRLCDYYLGFFLIH